MPSCAQHMGKVRSNLQFVESLLIPGPRFLDWAITGYFYSAVHLTEAYFDRFDAKHYGNHKNRRTAMVNNLNLSRLYTRYRQLETYSRVARYGVKQFDLTYIRQRVQPQFDRIRNAMAQLHPDLQV